MLIDILMGNYKQSNAVSKFAIKELYSVLREDWKSNLYHKGLYFKFLNVNGKEVPYIYIGGHWLEYEGTVPTLDDLNIVKKLFDVYVGDFKND